jgi:hypothetical protein
MYMPLLERDIRIGLAAAEYGNAVSVRRTFNEIMH